MPTADQTGTITTLASFDDAYPQGRLIADANGDLFGTTLGGGTNDRDTVFEIARTATGYASTLTTLANFNGTHLPNLGSLIADADGNLFGTAENLSGTTQGGVSGDDTVFELAKTATGYASAPTTLASFTEGEWPGSLIADADGDLFGTTWLGGAGLEGTVFELTRTASGYASAPTTLASFNGANGEYPGGLIADADGNLFGTTAFGGANGQGIVFELAKTAAGYAGTPTTLVSFSNADGVGYSASPQNLTLDSHGDLFGTMVEGGASHDGTVFELAKTATGYASTPTILARFNGPNGAYPTSLTIDGYGNLFGTTGGGGASGDGTVFELAKTAAGYTSTPTTLASFNGANGEYPFGLIADANGDLFGTSGGGASGNGTVFEITGSGFGVASANNPEPPTPDGFEVWDLLLGTHYSLSVPADAFADPGSANDNMVVAALKPDVFIQAGGGSDILAAQSGGDNVLDDSGGPANFEMGGAGHDAYFFDASHDPISWNTIVGFHAGDFAAIFGITPQDVAANAADGLGAPGYTGLTLRTTSESSGTAFVTLAGYGTEALTNGSLTTAFGTDPVSGREYMLIRAN